MDFDAEKISNNFLELASEQRLNILQNLRKKNLNITKLAKILDATNPEVHRNVGRLSKHGLIAKNTDGTYRLTTYGNAILLQIPSIEVMSENREFFNEHTISNLNTKFVQRIGQLQNKKHIKGFVKVIEKWKKIQENADKFLNNILPEIPYSDDIIEVIATKLEKNIPIRSIFPESVIVPEDRKKLFEEKGFQKHVSKGTLQRKISKNKIIGMLVTDKEAGIFFSRPDGEPDLSEMFTSTDKDFRDWCEDYFKEEWEKAVSFQESKITK